ncbi:MAG: hypothetical protein OER88_07155, partial [Planctomycetota bacterium]|nr:hypothetical protein [Planctomycetota bacterium]
PVRDIGKVVFGRLADPERIERTRAWIEDLASGDSRRRAMAKMALLRDGRFAVPDIERAAEKHSDPEVKRLCKEIVDELNIPEDRRLNDKDLVETKAFSFRGAIQPQSFQVRVIELGGLNIRRRDIATITVYRPEMVQRIKFDGQHTLREWLDTEIKLKKGERFEILASGTIRFPAWGTTGVFSPEGNPNSNMNNFKLGTLLGRIDNGTWFKIGQDYRGRANATGTLHICLNINVNRGNQQSTGNFEIEIRRDGG